MLILESPFSRQDFVNAQEHALFRRECKDYLHENSADYDKFTMVEHDTYVAYITELAIKEYLNTLLGKCGAVVMSWAENYDVSVLKRIIRGKSREIQDIALVKEYFYDKYDIKIVVHGKEFLVDVKTALTDNEPHDYWTFLYPVVQVNKEGKDAIILAYYVAKKKSDLTTIKNIVVAGYTTPDIIRKCKRIGKGEFSKFYTKSQIDNYETKLSEHYKSMNEFLNEVLKKP